MSLIISLISSPNSLNYNLYYFRVMFSVKFFFEDFAKKKKITKYYKIAIQHMRPDAEEIYKAETRFASETNSWQR